MKVLVTGASGFVGSHLARRLAREGHEVLALARPASRLDHLLADGLPIRRVEGDIRDPASLARACEGADAVFHAAARLGLWGGLSAQQDQVNVAGTRNVCEAARRAGVRRLVHTSSVAAVGFLPGDGPADETAAFTEEAASSSYARTKHAAEIEVLRAVEAGLDAVMVNPTVVYGIRPNRHYLANILEDLVAGRMRAYPTGGVSWVWVEDVVDGHLLAWRKGEAGRRYILGAENLPYHDFMRTVCRLAGSSPPWIPVPGWAIRPVAEVLEAVSARTGRPPLLSRDIARACSRHLYYSAERARRELGWTPTPLEEAVRRMLPELQGHASTAPGS